MTGARGADTRHVRAEIDQAARLLNEAGVAQPHTDARILLAHALGRPGERLYGLEDLPVDGAEAARFARMITRRQAREPVSRIVGWRGFWDLELELGPATLDPRPDSETLVEAVQAGFPDRHARLSILDLGTGTGCLLLAALRLYPRATGLGIDLSDACVTVARNNAGRHGLADRARFRAGNWCRGIEDRFEVILCNPPYVASGTIATLEPEVAVHDPALALDGGSDGLGCYRELAPQLARRLADGGRVFLEIGHDQRDGVAQIALDAGLAPLAVRRDLAGRDRCLVLAVAGSPSPR